MVIGSNPFTLINFKMIFVFKKKAGIIRLNINSGKANASPPIGPALGQKGLNISFFCKDFNNITSNYDSKWSLPVLISYYSDKTYDFFLKKPTVTFYLKNIFLGEISNIAFSDIIDLIKFKILDFNTFNIYSSLKIVLSVLKSMNIFLKFAC